MGLISLQCGDLLATLDAARARVQSLSRRDDGGMWVPLLRADPRPDPGEDWRGAVEVTLGGGVSGGWAIHDRSPASARLRLERGGAIGALFRAEVTPGAVALDLDTREPALGTPAVTLALMRTLGACEELELSGSGGGDAPARRVARWTETGVTMHLDASGAAREIREASGDARCRVLSIAAPDGVVGETRVTMRFTSA